MLMGGKGVSGRGNKLCKNIEIEMKACSGNSK